MVYLLLSAVFPGENKIPDAYPQKVIYLVENLLLLPGLLPIKPIITVAWSLSYEIFYYLSVPIIIGAFNLRQHSKTWRVIFFLSITLVLCIYCASIGGPIRLIMFISGILLYEAMTPKQITVRSAIGLPALMIGLLFTLLPISDSGILVIKILVLFVSFFFVCLCCFGNPEGFLAKAFSWRPIRWLGNMSYSYYLIHGLSLKAAFLVVTILFTKYEGPLMFWGLMPVMFMLTIVTATILFLCIERPLSLIGKINKDSRLLQTPATQQ
jgi:peptidoglycan/LPS O-acetylase OafA/YrhL